MQANLFRIRNYGQICNNRILKGGSIRIPKKIITKYPVKWHCVHFSALSLKGNKIVIFTTK